jgi:hypothetical protein
MKPLTFTKLYTPWSESRSRGPMVPYTCRTRSAQQGMLLLDPSVHYIFMHQFVTSATPHKNFAESHASWPPCVLTTSQTPSLPMASRTTKICIGASLRGVPIRMLVTNCVSRPRLPVLAMCQSLITISLAQLVYQNQLLFINFWCESCAESN